MTYYNVGFFITIKISKGNRALYAHTGMGSEVACIYFQEIGSGLYTWIFKPKKKNA